MSISESLTDTDSLILAPLVFMTQWSGHKVWFNLCFTWSGEQFSHNFPDSSYSNPIVSKGFFLDHSKSKWV